MTHLAWLLMMSISIKKFNRILNPHVNLFVYQKGQPMKIKHLILPLSLVYVAAYAGTSPVIPVNQLMKNPTPVATPAVPAATPKSRKVYHKHIVKQINNNYYFLNNRFDFSYSGDVANIPSTLQQYDPTVHILPNLGTSKPYAVNLDIQNVKLSDIQAFVDSKTDGRAKIVYDANANTLRIIYDTRITVANDAIKQSQIWQDGGTPSPVLSRNGLVEFPYGQYEPKVTCQPLQLCDIQLQAGEIIKGLMIGDSVRWNEGDGAIPIVYSGPDSNQIPHVVLKPSDAGLVTTLLVTTDKRTYYIKLYSTNSVSVSRTGFYYPGEQIQQLEQKRSSSETIANQTLSNDMVNPKNMHFTYKISGDTDAPFNPVQVFDDGSHVYIQMPTTIPTKSLPAFYVLAPDGETLQFVNFRYKAPFYIVDKMFDTGVLVLGLDENEQRITISHYEKKGFWSSLFGG